jgi:hypothetical protein
MAQRCVKTAIFNVLPTTVPVVGKFMGFFLLAAKYGARDFRQPSIPNAMTKVGWLTRAEHQR